MSLNPPTPISATYAPATRVGVINFDRPITYAGGMGGAVLRVSRLDQRRNNTGVTVTGPSQITVTFSTGFTTLVAPDGFTYTGVGATLRGVEGIAVAPFTAFPYVVV